MAALKEVDFSGTMTLEPVPPYPSVGIAIQIQEYLPLRDTFAEESIRYLKGIEASLA
jgi:hypothetical protein